MRTITFLSLVIFIFGGCNNKNTTPKTESGALRSAPLSIREGFLGLRWGDMPSDELQEMTERDAVYDSAESDPGSSHYTGGVYLGNQVSDWFLYHHVSPTRFYRVLIIFEKDTPLSDEFLKTEKKLASFLGPPEQYVFKSKKLASNDAEEESREFARGKNTALAQWMIPRAEDSVQVMLKVDGVKNPYLILVMGPISVHKFTNDSLTHQDSLDFKP